ncbi:hypothetical protein GCM10027579_00660 [Calidifontibacter terrae]
MGSEHLYRHLPERPGRPALFAGSLVPQAVLASCHGAPPGVHSLRKAIVMTEEIEQSDEATAAQTAATLLEDSLVEDVSIDGMCGVY